MAATTSYVTNPYLGNINPGDSNDSKLYMKATEPLDKKITRLRSKSIIQISS